MAKERDIPKGGKNRPPKGDIFGSEDLLAKLEEKARQEQEILAVDAIKTPVTEAQTEGSKNASNAFEIGEISGGKRADFKRSKGVLNKTEDMAKEKPGLVQIETQEHTELGATEVDNVVNGAEEPTVDDAIQELNSSEISKKINKIVSNEEDLSNPGIVKQIRELGEARTKAIVAESQTKEAQNPLATEPAPTPENLESASIFAQNEQNLNEVEKAGIDDARKKIEETEDKDVEGETGKSDLVRVVAVDMTETVNKVAYSNAREILAEQDREVGGFKGTFRKAIKPMRFKKIYDAEVDRIHREGFNQHDRVIAATVNRFGRTEHGLDSLHAEEDRKTLGEKPQDLTATTAVKKLVEDYARSEMGDEEFLDKKDKLLRYELSDGAAKDVMNNTNYRKQKMFADNLLKVAAQAREAVQDGREPNLNLEIVAGRAGEATGTEVRLGRVEAFLKKVDDHPAGSLLTTGSLGTIMALVYSGAVLGSEKGARTMASAGTLGLGGGMAAAGIIEGVRAGKDFKTELAIYQKKRALGEVEENPELEGLILETKNAYDLLSNLDEKGFGGPPDARGVYPKRELSEDPTQREAELKEIVSSLVEIEARIALRDRERIDLFSVSGEKDENLHEALNSLDESRAMVKLDLQEYGREGQLIDGEPVMKFFLREREDKINFLIEGSEDEQGILANKKDQEAATRRVAFKTGKRAALYTGIMGATLQEVVATFSDKLSGVVDLARNPEIQSDGAVHNTPLAELANYLSGNKSFDTLQSQTIEGGYSADISYGSEIVKVGDHYELMSGSQSLGEVNFNPDGTISEETINRLSEKGIKIDSHLETSTEVVPQEEANFEANKEISRTWMDNNTEGTYEKNELRFDMERHGNNVVLDVNRMLESGSFHGGTVENMPGEVGDGNARILISPTEGSQHAPIILTVDQDGKVSIPLDSEIGKNLFGTNENGGLVYNGSTIEAAIDKGLDENGKEHMHVLATIVGENSANDFEPSPLPEAEKVTSFAVNTVEVPTETVMDVPPPIPVIPEKRKERREQEEAAVGGVVDETVGETDETATTVAGAAASEAETAETPITSGTESMPPSAYLDTSSIKRALKEANEEASIFDEKGNKKKIPLEQAISESGEDYDYLGLGGFKELALKKSDEWTVDDIVYWNTYFNNMEISTDKERSARIAEKALEIFREKNVEGANAEDVQAEAAEQALNSIYKAENAQGSAGQNGQNQEGQGEKLKTIEEQVNSLIERLSSLNDRTGLSAEFIEILDEAYNLGIITRPNKTNNIQPKRGNKRLGERFLDSLSKLEIVATHPHRNRNELMNNANMIIEHLTTAGEERKNPGLTKPVQDALDLAFERRMIGRRKGSVFGINKAGERFIEALLPNEIEFINTGKNAKAPKGGEKNDEDRKWSIDVGHAGIVEAIENAMITGKMTAEKWEPYSKKLIPNITKNSKNGEITEAGIEEVARGLRLNTDDQKRFVSAMKSALGEPK